MSFPSGWNGLPLDAGTWPLGDVVGEILQDIYAYSESLATTSNIVLTTNMIDLNKNDFGGTSVTGPGKDIVVNIKSENTSPALARISNTKGNNQDFPSFLGYIGSKVFFQANNSSGYSKIHYYDKEANRIYQVSDIVSGGDDGNSGYAVVYGNKLYLVANDPNGYDKFMCLDPVAKTITKLADLKVGDSDSVMDGLYLCNGEIYFSYMYAMSWPQVAKSVKYVPASNTLVKYDVTSPTGMAMSYVIYHRSKVYFLDPLAPGFFRINGTALERLSTEAFSSMVGIEDGSNDYIYLAGTTSGMGEYSMLFRFSASNGFSIDGFINYVGSIERVENGLFMSVGVDQYDTNYNYLVWSDGKNNHEYLGEFGNLYNAISYLGVVYFSTSHSSDFYKNGIYSLDSASLGTDTGDVTKHCTTNHYLCGGYSGIVYLNGANLFGLEVIDIIEPTNVSVYNGKVLGTVQNDPTAYIAVYNDEVLPTGSVLQLVDSGKFLKIDGGPLVYEMINREPSVEWNWSNISVWSILFNM